MQSKSQWIHPVRVACWGRAMITYLVPSAHRLWKWCGCIGIKASILWPNIADNSVWFYSKPQSSNASNNPAGLPLHVRCASPGQKNESLWWPWHQQWHHSVCIESQHRMIERWHNEIMSVKSSLGGERRSVVVHYKLRSLPAAQPCHW